MSSLACSYWPTSILYKYALDQGLQRSPCTDSEMWLPIVCNLQQCLYILQDGMSPLFVAAQENHEEVVKVLLIAGANLDLARQVRKIVLVQFKGEYKEEG